MIRYVKGVAPARLTTAATTPGATWDGLAAVDRDPVRDALVRDQGALCAYCQRRIRTGVDPRTGRSRMKIEHWRSRSTHPDQQLVWSNMLGVCLGRTEHDPHCDESRGNRPLFLHPVEGQGPDPRTHVRYTKDGKVEPDRVDQRVADDIRALNLNAHALSRGRAAVYDAMMQRWERAGFASQELRRIAREHEIVPGVEGREHAEFVRYHVVRKLRQRGETL